MTLDPKEDPTVDLANNLKRLSDSLDELNSAFPETQKFLRDRGLTKVSQLDEAGRRQLTEHLRSVLSKISS